MAISTSPLVTATAAWIVSGLILALISSAMPSFANMALSAAAVGVWSTKPIDFALSIACLKASTVLRSGFAAPLRMATPMPARAMAMRGTSATLPAVASSSSAALVSSTASNASPPSIRAFSCADVPSVTTSLFPVAFSNCGPSSSITAFSALPPRSFMSAAWVAVVASGNPNTAMTAIARWIFMASSRAAGLGAGGKGRLAVNRCNRQELVSLEAGAADQRAVDIVDAEQLLGIRRLDGAAVENPNALPGIAITGAKPLADEAVHVENIVLGRRHAGADRPDRLIGDDEIRKPIRQRAVELRAHDRLGLAGIAFGARLADTDDGEEAGAARRQRLGAHHGIGLAVIVPALGMADDDGAGAGIFEHFGGDIARIGAGRLGVAVLAADGDARTARRLGKARHQRSRRTYYKVGTGQTAGAGDDRLKLAGRGRKPVHFPIASDQRTARHHFGPKILRLDHDPIQLNRIMV